MVLRRSLSVFFPRTLVVTYILYRWRFSHATTNFLMSFRILGQKYRCRIFIVVLNTPRWPEVGRVWLSCRTAWISFSEIQRFHGCKSLSLLLPLYSHSPSVLCSLVCGSFRTLYFFHIHSFRLIAVFIATVGARDKASATAFSFPFTYLTSNWNGCSPSAHLATLRIKLSHFNARWSVTTTKW